MTIPVDWSPEVIEPAADAEQAASQALALCLHIQSLDKEISSLEAQIAPLPPLVDALIRMQHPVLWLVLGREGIDRPGGFGAIVGQQVVYRRDRQRELLLVVMSGAIGAALGVLTALLLHIAI